jgi:hypothetical protein
LVEAFYRDLIECYPKAFKQLMIIQGLGSVKKYPLENKSGVAQTEDKILSNYKAVYALNPSLVFMMKPPREAMITKMNCPDTVVFCYGSFNWRTLNLPLEDYQALMGRYKTFHYMDSFSVIGELNSFQFHPKPNGHGVQTRITDMITGWNHHILDKCRQDLASSTDENEINRSKKIITNIETKETTQFVLADVCLFLGDPPTERVNLVSIKPYAKWEPADTSSIYVYGEKGKMERLEKLLQTILDL